MTRIYIAYRSDDAAIAQQIYDRAILTHGVANVLMNPEANPDYEDRLVEYIDNLVGGCTIIVLVIGPSWTGVDEYGRFRLSAADMPLYAELRAAFTSTNEIIPVLVNGVTALPVPDEVPEEFHELYEFKPVILRPTQWRTDLQRFIEAPPLARRMAYWLKLEWLRRRRAFHDRSV